MLKEVECFAKDFLKESKEKSVKVISNSNSDSIASTAILIKTFQRLDKKFSVNIMKELNKETVEKELKKVSKQITLFCGFSYQKEYFKNLKETTFLINSHISEIEKASENIYILNLNQFKNPENNCSCAELTYLFSISLSKDNKDLSKIAMIGLVQNKEISKISEKIIDDTNDLIIKKGLTLYPSTRPLKRALEYSISPYIPGVTGNQSGVIEMLKKIKISEDKSLIELKEDEMSRLIEEILIRTSSNIKQDGILGNLYTIKFFGKMEDLREISVIINACSRLGYSDIAINYCLENEKAKTKALDIYTEYKTELVSGLRTAEKITKINGKGFVILNAGNKIKEAIVGTVCSMLSSSRVYEEGTILIAMAYNKDKIKISARIAGKKGRNLKEVMEKTITMYKDEHPETKIEFKGNPESASCLIEKEDESSFIETLKKNLEIEVIRI